LRLSLDGLKSGEFLSVYSAAKAHGVCETTLCARAKGDKSLAEGNVLRQLLTDAEKNALVRWVSRLTANGFPVMR
jgi:hypothetical protein